MSSNNAATSANNAKDKEPKEKKHYSKEDWQKRLNDVKVNKADLDKLVMNYLVIEGYKDAAEKFSAESGIAPGIDLASIEDRMNIRNSIQNGRVEDAIERVNDLDPEILDTNPKLFFHLQLQRLIELIHQGNIIQALEFAQEELAPRGEENEEFLEELEKTMALMAFDSNSTDLSKNPVSYLLDHRQRQKTASELNAAILASQCQDKDPKLPQLLKMLVWAQQQLSAKATFPIINNLVTASADLESALSTSSTSDDLADVATGRSQATAMEV